MDPLQKSPTPTERIGDLENAHESLLEASERVQTLESENMELKKRLETQTDEIRRETHRLEMAYAGHWENLERDFATKQEMLLSEKSGLRERQKTVKEGEAQLERDAEICRLKQQRLEEWAAQLKVQEARNRELEQDYTKKRKDIELLKSKMQMEISELRLYYRQKNPNTEKGIHVDDRGP